MYTEWSIIYISSVIKLLYCTMQVTKSLIRPEVLQSYKCPCCDYTPCSNSVSPRKALQTHIKRRSKSDPTHALWYDAQYNRYFSKNGGKDMTDRASILNAITLAFGEDWSHRFQLYHVPNRETSTP